MAGFRHKGLFSTESTGYQCVKPEDVPRQSLHVKLTPIAPPISPAAVTAAATELAEPVFEAYLAAVDTCS